jgi:hypothetical protein
MSAPLPAMIMVWSMGCCGRRIVHGGVWSGFQLGR